VPALEPADRVSDPALTAAQDLARGLRDAGVTVTGTSGKGTAGAGADQVAAVPGLPIGTMVRRMLTYSDDDLGEALARLVALKAGLAGDAAGAGQVLEQTAQALGAAPGSVIAHDGSGLSHADRVPLSVLVTTLLKAPTDLLAGLPVAARTGTLADRFRTGTSAAAAGKVRAKTGALLGVNTLVGLATLPDGQLLAFGFGSDAVTYRTGAEAALDACAAALTEL
jgi:D-alanyl-D-alanine carboxypeptidase/D-alanyl-D-alanine-endopeptidase (penicillin-binding protein 4)